MRKTYNVPGASLAVLVDGKIKALACGLLHQGTGVEATTDSLFQIGSISKVYTAALVKPAPFWNLLPRSSGPSGGALCATAADLIRFAQIHLNGSLTPDNIHVLTSKSVAAMQRLAAETPDKWTSGNLGWGLGWMIYDWNGVPVFGHDGATIGQNGYLRVIPGRGVAVALLANGGNTDLLQSVLFRELFEELAGARMPDTVFEPVPQPPMVDIKAFVGVYKRQGVVMTVTERNEMLHLLYEIFDGRQAPSPPLEIALSPVSETVFAGASTGQDWIPVVFSTLTDSTFQIH